MYSETTQSVTIYATPYYLDDQSSPIDNYYVWRYDIQIVNEAPYTVQLLRRHWKIIDASGHMQEVVGSGVVGAQPVLRPGESFEYTSGTHLNTPSGMMMGNYEMADEAGQVFSVVIPAFSLDCPHVQHNIN